MVRKLICFFGLIFALILYTSSTYAAGKKKSQVRNTTTYTMIGKIESGSRMTEDTDFFMQVTDEKGVTEDYYCNEPLGKKLENTKQLEGEKAKIVWHYEKSSANGMNFRHINSLEFVNQKDSLYGKSSSNSNAEDSSTTKVSDGDVIQPFGSFSWHDGLNNVINKLNAIGTIENTQIANSASALWLNNKYSKKLQINEIIANIDEAERNHHTGENYHNDVVEDVIIGKYVRDQFRIDASPIIISNVEYKIVIILESNPGFAINHPDEVIISKRNIKYPLLIKSISFYTINNDININKKYMDVDKLLYKKYSKFNSKSDVKYYRDSVTNKRLVVESPNSLYFNKYGFLSGEVSDKYKSRFKAESGINSLSSFEYSSSAYHDAYKRKHGENIQQIETIKNSGKKDMKEGL